MNGARIGLRWLVGGILGLALSAPGAVGQYAASGSPETLDELVSARESQLGRTVTAAIFMKNRAGVDMDQPLRAFEDQAIGAIDASGVSVISSEDVVTAINRLRREGDERIREMLRSGDDSDLDRLLNDSTSALRLAQDMGADYMLMISVTDYGTRRQAFRSDELGIDRSVITHQLRASYKVLSSADGATETAGNVVARYREQELAGNHNDLVMGDLFDDASNQIAEGLRRAVEKDIFKQPRAIPMSRFTVAASMQDLMVPEVIENDDGELILGANRYQVEALSVDVLLNGTFVGTSEQVIEAPAGFHVLRLEREGFEPWERRLKLPEIGEDESPALFQTALRMNSSGLSRFREMTQMFQDLKAEYVLTQAEADRVRGLAQMLEQSGLRVDLRHASDVSVGWQRGGGAGEAAGNAVRSAWRRLAGAGGSEDE
ncbi:MAG: PEGA domain-containing protein [Planctomycetota bacterium]